MHNQAAKSIPNLPNNIIGISVNEEQTYLTRSSSQPIVYNCYSDYGQSSSSVSPMNKSTQTEFQSNLNEIDYETLEVLVLSNPHLVLSILGLKANLPVNLITNIEKETDPLLLTTIPERTESSESTNNIKNGSMNEYNFHSTDTLLSNTTDKNPEPDVTFNSESLRTVKAVERAIHEQTNNKRKKFKNYERFSSESLTDSHGYMDDFSESCALLVSDNNRKFESSIETITKRNNSKHTDKMWRFSAGDAELDKLEKGIKNLPSTRSLKDH